MKCFIKSCLLKKSPFWARVAGASTAGQPNLRGSHLREVALATSHKWAADGNWGALVEVQTKLISTNFVLIKWFLELSIVYSLLLYSCQ